MRARVRAPPGRSSARSSFRTDEASGGHAEFGISVALSGDGDTALIGGYQDGFEVSGESTGAAWVFTRSAGGFTQLGSKLTANNESSGDSSSFGASVALSNDGGTALIGGPDDEPSGDTGSEFGHSVALSGDANTALIGGALDGASSPRIRCNPRRSSAPPGSTSRRRPRRASNRARPGRRGHVDRDHRGQLHGDHRRHDRRQAGDVQRRLARGADRYRPARRGQGPDRRHDRRDERHRRDVQLRPARAGADPGERVPQDLAARVEARERLERFAPQAAARHDVLVHAVRGRDRAARLQARDAGSRDTEALGARGQRQDRVLRQAQPQAEAEAGLEAR